ncbi:MAG: hypothetical protein J1F07_02140 [Muribaculaceae bacterium]|nr:hypothetical protein [Muribaculaceae bacterium]
MMLSREYINVVERTLRRCFPVVVSHPWHRDFSDPFNFGSGFLMELDGKTYCITAMHVVSPHNYPEYKRWHANNICGVPSGKTDYYTRQHLFLTLCNRSEMMMTQKQASPDDFICPEPFDASFCDGTEVLNTGVSLGFQFSDWWFRIPMGSPREAFGEGDIIPDSDIANHDYFVVGSILGMAKGGMQYTRHDKLHIGLKYSGRNLGDITLEAPTENDRTRDWAALSGSPVVSDDGRLLGMLVNVADGRKEINVMPMAKIVEKIKTESSLEASGFKDDYYIVVGPGMTMEDVKNNPAVKEMIDGIHHAPLKVIYD